MLKAANTDGLSDHLAAVIMKLVEQGFEEPIMFVALGANGSVLAGSFAGSEFTMSAERYFDDLMGLPINMMFVDSKSGEAARVFLQRPDQEEYTINESVSTPVPTHRRRSDTWLTLLVRICGTCGRERHLSLVRSGTKLFPKVY